jgi:hypothetical protein
LFESTLSIFDAPRPFEEPAECEGATVNMPATIVNVLKADRGADADV